MNRRLICTPSVFGGLLGGVLSLHGETEQHGGEVQQPGEVLARYSPGLRLSPWQGPFLTPTPRSSSFVLLHVQ